MSFLFPQKKPKTLSEIVYALNEWVLRVRDPSGSSQAGGLGSPASAMSVAPDITLNEQQRQAVEECSKLLAQVRKATWAQPPESGIQPEPDQLTALAKEVYSTDVLVPLLQNLRLLEFDARRDVANFFGYVLKRQPTIDYLLHKVPEVFTILLGSAGDVDVHRTICQILRECARHEALVAYVINLQSFWWFFQYIDDLEFEVATDNFSTFQDFLRNYPELSTQFLLRNADYFTQCINGLIRSNNYVAKRQSLRLLFQLIKQQRNHQYLLVYVDSLENLKLIMRLLKDKSKNIHFEAFQIFKVFVANPNKPKPVLEVLVRNKSKLLAMLDKSHTLADRREDQMYQKERDYVRDKILALPEMRPPTGSTPDLRPANTSLEGQDLVKRDQQSALPSYVKMQPVSPSRAQVSSALLDARPASPISSHAQSPHNPQN